MAVFLDIKGVAFKPRAFERAAESIAEIDEDITTIYRSGGLKALEKIGGVGKGIAERIEEYIETGRIKDYESLKKELPVNVTELNQVEGIGPHTIKKLYEKLKITNLGELEKAVNSGNLVRSKTFSKKSEEKIKKGLEFLKSGDRRYPIFKILPVAGKLREKITAIPGVKTVEYGGSLRRQQETIGDLDLIAFSDKPRQVVETFIKFPQVESVYSHGMRKALVRLRNGMDADLIVLPPKSVGSALIAWTGNKAHNIAIRKLAEKKGWSLNDYGLWKVKSNKPKSKKEELIAGKTEEEVYKKLGMDWIPPELRMDQGEIEAALKHKLPNLIEAGDIQGDLQVQSDWTDGAHSIRQLAAAAKKYGLQYITITDHTQSLKITNGNDEKRLLQQMAEIDRINETLTDFKILKGVEVDILKDGSLDIRDDVLAQLDVVGASVHSYFSMSEEDMTKRIIRAIENPHVDILFHPTGRVVGRREPYKLDMEAIIKTAKKTKTVLEVNGFHRLDLKDEHIRKALAAGVKLAIDSDAHSTSHFFFLEYGVAQARRGWTEKKDVINTRPWPEMLKLLK